MARPRQRPAAPAGPPPSTHPAAKRSAEAAARLPEPFEGWFRSRGWRPRPHQLRLIEQAEAGRSTLLIAPTGAGKTLAGFLPSLIRLAGRKARAGRAKGEAAAGLSTLYISPLKALAVDVHRNLVQPVDEMGLDIRIETRTGDTPVGKRQRQRMKPPDMLLTTPEQLALLLSYPEAPALFGGLKSLVLDELHALAASKRGDLMALDVARLRSLAPGLVVTGLSATVAEPSELRAYIAKQEAPDERIALADLVVVEGGVAPDVTLIEAAAPPPWSGHTARYAVADMMAEIAAHRLTLVFVNTRSQAELLFQELWQANDQNLPIGLHHGSLAPAQRRKVEAAMAEGRLKAVVCTSTLDLGIDWGDVDLVLNVGAPKGASRLIQRIGRSNHRMDEPSKAILVPANTFEVLECKVALAAAKAGAQDARLSRVGALDVLAQHVIGMAAAGPFHPEAAYEEVRSAAPYAAITRATFERVVDFVATGGYALRAYERFRRLVPMPDGRLRLAHPRLAHQYRMNAGTILDQAMLKVRLVGGKRGRGRGGRPRLIGGRHLGEIDEYFISELVPGDTFLFAGEVVRFEGLVEMEAYVSRAPGREPKIPSYPGGRFPLSTFLADGVRALLADPRRWRELPAPVCDWLASQAEQSRIPKADEVLIETFPNHGQFYMAAYPFEGRLAHQTLGMLLTRRLERAGGRPLGFLANDYGVLIWAGSDLSALVERGRLDLTELFSEDMLGDDLDAWLADSSMLKRTFRSCAVIAGLIERRHPGKEKSGRQLTVSSDLIYQVLRRHDLGHILIEAAYQDAATGLLDIGRLGDFLKRIRGRIAHGALTRISPLSVPMMLEMGRESVLSQTGEARLKEAALRP